MLAFILEWFKCVGHMKNTSTLDCVQLVSSRKIIISANSKVPCLYRLYPSCTYVCTDCTSIVYIYISVLIVFWFYLFFYTDYLSVLQLYHRLLTVEQTHKVKVCTPTVPKFVLQLFLSCTPTVPKFVL